MERGALEHRVELVSRFLRGHAGGIELDHAGDDGEVRVTFTGMCTGCLFRPVTMATTIRPALLQIEGVKRVEATGARVSAEAEQRMEQHLAAWWERRRPAAKDPRDR